MRQRRFRQSLPVTVSVLILLLVVPAWLDGTDSEEMVLVRVFRNAQPVATLTCADFQLSENGIARPIDDCRNFRRRLAGRSDEKAPGRLLLLMADIQTVDNEVDAACGFLLQRVLVPGDELWLLCGNKQATWRIPNDPSNLRPAIIDWLRVQAHIGHTAAQDAMRASHEMMEKIMTDYRRITGGMSKNEAPARSQELTETLGLHRHYYMNYYTNALEQYQHVLHDYRTVFLFPDNEALGRLTAAARDRKGEKWLLVLRQLPPIPQMSPKQRKSIVENIGEFQGSRLMDENKYAEILNQILAALDSACLPGNDFPLDSMHGLLYQSGFTCHALFLPPADKTLARNGYWRRAAAELADGWQKLCVQTGGTLLQTTGEPEIALADLINREDTGYWLRYHASVPPERRNLHVTVNDPALEVEYARTSRTETVPGAAGQLAIAAPQITAVEFHQPMLHVIVETARPDATSTGKNLHIHIQVANSRGEVVYDQSKTLTPIKENVSVSISLAQLPPGSYIIQVMASVPPSSHTGAKSLEVEIR